METIENIFLEELDNNKSFISSLFYSIFQIQSKEVLRVSLESIYEIATGRNPHFQEYGKTNWFFIWHKGIRQGDFFNTGTIVDGEYIDGHLDMVIWKAVHVDIDQTLEYIFKEVFNKYAIILDDKKFINSF